MNEKELRALVERMVADLMGQAPTPQVKAADYRPMEPGPTGGGGGLPGIAQVNLRGVYPVPPPHNRPGLPGPEAEDPRPAGGGPGRGPVQDPDHAADAL